eukprot:2293231-Prymnesium_polylepis.1
MQQHAAAHAAVTLGELAPPPFGDSREGAPPASCAQPLSTAEARAPPMPSLVLQLARPSGVAAAAPAGSGGGRGRERLTAASAERRRCGGWAR